MYQTISQRSDWVKDLACKTMVLSVGSSGKRKLSAATTSLRKYFHLLQVSYVTLRPS